MVIKAVTKLNRCIGQLTSDDLVRDKLTHVLCGAAYFSLKYSASA